MSADINIINKIIVLDEGTLITSDVKSLNFVGADVTATSIDGNVTIDITGGSGSVTNVSASSPLASTGGATPNISIQQSSALQAGYLSATDWSNFNNKVSSSLLGANNGVATLDSGGKIPASQLPNSIMDYKGTYNIVTNTPALADGVGNTGDVYVNSVDGSRNFGSGVIAVKAGDWLVYNGTIWEKSVNSNNVVSVNGQTGVVTLGVSDISGAIGGTLTTNYIPKATGSGTLSDSVLYNNGSNIGIGVTSPISTLHVSSVNKVVSNTLYTSDFITLSAESTAPGFNIISSGDAVGYRGVFKATRSRGTLDVPTALINGDQTFSLVGAGHDGTTNLTTAEITFAVDGAVSTNVLPQAITFATGAGSSRTERMRITSTGNVGINFVPSAASATFTVKSTAIPSASESIASFQVTDSLATFAIQNYANTDSVFVPALVGNQATGANQIALNLTGYIASADDTGTNPIMTFRSATNSFTTVSTRPLFDFRNWSTSVMLIGANGNIGIGTTTPSNKLDVNGNTRIVGSLNINNTYTLPTTDGTVNQVLQTNGAGVVTWATVSSGSSGITSLNSLTAATQTFATGTSGTDFGISSTGSTHTFNIPTASATNRGLLSTADWTTFNNKGNGTVTSVGLSMPSAFTVSSSPVTGSGTIAVTGAGTTSQYVRGDGTLAAFPTVLPTNQIIQDVKLGEAISTGNAVYVFTADGTNIIVKKASNTSEATSSKTLGLLVTGGALNAQTTVLTNGKLAGLDTSTAVIGDAVWLGTNGQLLYGLANKPYAPAHLVYIGVVTRVNASNGEIFVNVQNGFELYELHNVSALTPSNNDGIFYNTSTSLWESKSIATALGYTPANKAGETFTGNISATNLSGTNTGDETTATIKTKLGAASSSADGYLTSTDWSTFNAKQNAITLTTTGSSGSATLVGSTLNIPAYTLAGLGGISLSSLSASTPLSYNSGTGAFSIQVATTAQNGYLSSTDWNTFNGKQAALSGTGFVKISGSTISYDNSTYLTGNQTITLSGDISGSGATSISTSISASTVTGKLLTGFVSGAGTVSAADSILSAIQKLDGNIGTKQATLVSGTNIKTVAGVSLLGSGDIGSIGDTYISSATTWNSKQAGSTILTNLSALSYSSGTPFIKMTGVNTFALDTSTYLTGNQTITLSGDVSGSGTTGITASISASTVTGKALTGFVSGAGTVSSSDSILQAIQKIDGNIGTKQATLVSGTNIKTINGSSILGSGNLNITSSAPFSGNSLSMVYNAPDTQGYFSVDSTTASAVTFFRVWSGDTVYYTNWLSKLLGNSTYVLQISDSSSVFGLYLVTNVVLDAGNGWYTYSLTPIQASGTFVFNNTYTVSFVRVGLLNSEVIGSTLTGYSSAAGTISSSDTILQAVQKLNGNTTNLSNNIGSSLIPVYKSNYVWRGITFSNNSTTVVVDGGVTTSTTASVTAQSVATTSYATRQIRVRYSATIVSSGRYTGVRGSALLWYVSGGFMYVCDVFISDQAYAAGCRQFYGLQGSTADLTYTDVTLVSSLINCIGIGSDSADTNLQVFYNDGSGTASKIDLGVNFPANRSAGAALTTMYTFIIYNAPGSTDVIYRVVNNEISASVEGTISTNLPATTQGLNFFASRCMGGGGGTTNSGQFDLSRLGCYSLL